MKIKKIKFMAIFIHFTATSFHGKFDKVNRRVANLKEGKGNED